MKKLLISVVSIFALGLMVSCNNAGNNGNESGESTDKALSSELPTIEISEEFYSQLNVPSEIRVGTSPDYPPFEYFDESGKISGFDIELFNALGEILGVTVVYTPLEFGTIVASLQTGNIDVGMSGFTYKEDRDVIFGTPYYSSAQVALLPIDSDIATVQDLEGKSIGAGQGTTGDDIARTIPNAQVTNPDNVVAFQMVQSGQLDAYICDDGVAKNYADSGRYKILDEVLQSEEMSYIIKNDNTEIEKALNEALEAFMGTTMYEELLEKHGLN